MQTAGWRADRGVASAAIGDHGHVAGYSSPHLVWSVPFRSIKYLCATLINCQKLTVNKELASVCVYVHVSVRETMISKDTDSVCPCHVMNLLYAFIIYIAAPASRARHSLVPRHSTLTTTFTAAQEDSDADKN